MFRELKKKSSQEKPNDWRSSHWTHPKRMQYAYETGFGSDSIFIVKKDGRRKEFKLHQFVLIISSHVFDEMLEEKLKQSKGSELRIEIKDVSIDTFDIMMKYIYFGEVPVCKFDGIFQVFLAANKYMIPSLALHCVKLLTNLKINNSSVAIKAYEVGSCYMLPELQQQAIRYIMNLTSDFCEHPLFLTMKLSTLLAILDQDELNISEVDLVKKVEQWLANYFQRKEITDEQKKSEIRTEIISKLRFISMTSQEFAILSNDIDLLTPEESFQILRHISAPAKCPLPNGFCSKSRKFISNNFETWSIDNFV